MITVLLYETALCYSIHNTCMHVVFVRGATHRAAVRLHATVQKGGHHAGGWVFLPLPKGAGRNAGRGVFSDCGQFRALESFRQFRKTRFIGLG